MQQQRDQNFTWPNNLSINLIRVIFKFLPQHQLLEMRLVNNQFKYNVEYSLTKLEKINNIGNLESFNSFIKNFPNLIEIKLPSIVREGEMLKTCDDSDLKEEKLQKIEFQNFLTRPQASVLFLQNFFSKYKPKSIGLWQFMFIDEIPYMPEVQQLHLENIRELKNCFFLTKCQELEALSISVHEDHQFFEHFENIALSKLKMLKIRLWGPNFHPEKIRGVKRFVQAIPQVEVLELILDIYNDTNEKQIVFDTFMSLPSKLLSYLELKIVNLKNCTHQIIETQLNKVLNLLIFDNNIQTSLVQITQKLFEKFLAFSKILDLTNCVLSQNNQEEINQWLIDVRQAPQKSIQTTNIKVQQHQLKISFDHEYILTNYELPPVVQRNEPFKTLWDSQYYSI